MRSPTLADSQWGGVRRLLQSIDRQIADLYAQRGVDGVPPRYSMALIRLHARGDMTIKELAAEVDVTHSAMSQTVANMRRDDLVTTIAGTDARTRFVTLTDSGRELVPFLETEWWATEAVLEQIDREAGGGLSAAVAAISAVLEDRTFADRLRQQLRDSPS